MNTTTTVLNTDGLTVVTISLTQTTGNVLVHLPRQVVSRTGSEERVGCPNHKGVLVAARTKQKRQKLQYPTETFGFPSREKTLHLLGSELEINYYNKVLVKISM